MKQKICFILSIIFILSFCGVYALAVHREISDGIIRLHIVANSDSFTDQSAKLAVRDAIINTVKNDFSVNTNKEEFKALLSQNQNKIKEIADRVLLKSGLDYKSHISLEKVYIPRKSYKNIILPEGKYDALVIRLGESYGKNWWCIVYPPLCFTEESVGDLSDEGIDYLKNVLSDESLSLINRDAVEIEYKFKLVELFQRVKNHYLFLSE